MTTWVDDVSHEYRHFNNRKIVTVSTSGSIDTEPNQDEISWSNDGTTEGGAITRDLSKARSVFGGINLTGDERDWIIPDILLINLGEILPGYLISEDAIADISELTTKWVVQQAQKVNFGTQWTCLCLKQR